MKIESIVIVGGGSAGWMTAATLVRAFPNKKITVIEPPTIPTVGVGESTLSSIKRWVNYLQIDELDFLKNTDASLKLSIKFTDFYKKDSGSFHYPFGMPMQVGDRNPFFDWHLKQYLYPNTAVEDMANCLFPASALYNNNKFSLNINGEFDNFTPFNDVAYHFNATKFAEWLREAYCMPRGVKLVSEEVSSVIVGDSGIEKLVLQSGNNITADLYVDCTGFRSLLLGDSLKEPFDSYSNILPNNKAWATQVPYKDRSRELEGYTNCTAIENGWCWNIPLWTRLGSGYVYSDKYVSDDEALDQFKSYLISPKMVIKRSKSDIEKLKFKSISMRVGIHNRTFVKNVVAIGLSAGFIEPLESNGLFSVHEFLFKLVDILHRDEIVQFDRDMYNVSIRDLFDGFAKFVSMHYALSHRDDTEYWRDCNDRVYGDRHGDPYSQHDSRVGGFYNMTYRYMEKWGHPDLSINNGGIAYISTGMRVRMMNESRLMYINQYNANQQVNNIEAVIEEWERRKFRWALAAEASPTLEQFLKDTVYYD